MMQYWSMILFQRTQATNSNHMSCFSPLLHAPATARTQLATTCKPARYAETHPVQPLKGHREPRAASVSYRASVPAGHAYCEVASSHRALAPAEDRQNGSFKALSGKGSAPATPPPFRHTPFRPRPRHTATVWRNPGRHPHRDGTFTFSAKERDSETGLSYFGSRYYSSDLGIWLSVDPMSDKYASLSPYTYCANNPVKLVDPNGEDIEIVTIIDGNGNKIITINFTAKIVNKSSHSFNESKMTKMKDEISAGIRTYFSGQYDGATVKVNVDIICDNDEKTDDFWKEESRHSIFIVDKCSEHNWIAEAEIGGNFMKVRWDIGQGSNDNKLKRTVSHEFGHLLGLPDVDIEGNLMKSGGTGVDVTWGQIQEAVSNYSQHRINNGILIHLFDNYIYNHH